MGLPIRGIGHVNLNCSDLSASRTFFEASFAMRARIHTDPEPQDGRAFGIEGAARWDAWMMQDARDDSTPIDLLEWKQPRPCGEPHRQPERLGLRRLAWGSRTLEACHARVLEAGARGASELVELELPNGETRRAFGARDPDGVDLLVFEASSDHLDHVQLGCLDLERSSRFYGDVLGLVSSGSHRATAATGAPFGWQATVAWSAEMFRHEADGGDGFAVALLQWEDPKASGQPYACAHHLGLYRMAFLVDDLDLCHGQLQELRVEGLGEPVDLDLGPSCPAPRCRALFFQDPDGTCLELIETPAAARA